MSNYHLDVLGGYAQLVQQDDLGGLKSELRRNEDFPEIAVRLLSAAIIEEKVSIVEWLLEEGVNPNRCDPFADGRSSLWYAVIQNNKRLIRILVEHGATVERAGFPDFDDDTALHVAVGKGDPDLVRLLIEKAEGKSAFEVYSDNDRSPLHCAVYENDLEAAKLLLDSGHDPNALVQVQTPQRVGFTPISDSVGSGYVEMTRLLLRYGADPDRPGWMWNSARDRLKNLEEPARLEMVALLELPPLSRLSDSGHFVEVERQLLADLDYHGFSNLKLDWTSSRSFGRTVQVRGDRLARFVDILLYNDCGETVGRGEFGFLVLTVELEFRVFWSELRVKGETIMPGKGTIPRHVWQSLSEEQRSWLIMDSRNEYKAEQPGLMLVDGEAVR